jgi:hypothetical protein
MVAIAAPAHAAGDGRSLLRAYGDFDKVAEYAIVRAEPFAVGIFLHDDPPDDRLSDDRSPGGARACIGGNTGALRGGLARGGLARGGLARGGLARGGMPTGTASTPR